VTALEAPVLYERLPAVYREHDADGGFPLRALLAVIAEQAALVEQDVEQLLDDFFVETAQPRVLPLIAELVGNDLLYEASRIAPAATAETLFDDLAGTDLRPRLTVPLRADIAKTISYRRRKGTLPMLEELARDVTGWPAHAVEFFGLLGRTEHVDHVRAGGGWLDLRSPERADRIDRAFDEAAHTVDVRPPSTFEGWHGLDSIGLFLWRLRGYELVDVPARAADRAWRLHASALGNPAPLFSRWRREGDEAGLATELHVPGPIRHTRFHADLGGEGALYGPFQSSEASLHVVVNGTPVPREQIRCRQLVPWPAAQPTGSIVAVDVAAGRLAVGAGFGALTGVDVSYHYGFQGDLGGGPYDRGAWLVRGGPNTLRLAVTEGAADDPVAGRFGSVQAALAHWSSAEVGRPETIVTIRDSRAYALPASVTLHNERRLVIQAADGERPVLRTPTAGDPGLEIKVDVPPGEPDRGSELTLSGVVVEGHLNVSGDLGRLRLLHSTIVPGRRLSVNGLPQTTDVAVRARGFLGPEPINEQLRLEIAYSITGPLLIAPTAAGLWLLDSIADGLGGAAIRGPIHSSGEQPACPTVIERSTALGRVRVRSLTAVDSIVAGEAICERVQTGEVRGTFTIPGSRTPRRIRCQPDRAVEAAVRERERRAPKPTEAEVAAIRAEVEGWLAPTFTSTRYGRPGYAQLRVGCPAEIAAGAEDGSEMGAFSHLKQPQRESNLRLRLGEYLPFGLESGLIYVT
jgi:hypothetical protein